MALDWLDTTHDSPEMQDRILSYTVEAATEPGAVPKLRRICVMRGAAEHEASFWLRDMRSPWVRVVQRWRYRAPELVFDSRAGASLEAAFDALDSQPRRNA